MGENIEDELLKKDDIYLKQIPVINETLNFEQKDDVVNIIFKNNNRFQNLLRKIGFKIPKITTLELDEYSSYVFLQIDGKKTIYEIGQNLKNSHGQSVDPLYERLVIYFDFLENNKKWISYKEE